MFTGNTGDRGLLHNIMRIQSEKSKDCGSPTRTNDALFLTKINLKNWWRRKLKSHNFFCELKETHQTKLQSTALIKSLFQTNCKIKLQILKQLKSLLLYCSPIVFSNGSRDWMVSKINYSKSCSLVVSILYNWYPVHVSFLVLIICCSYMRCNHCQEPRWRVYKCSLSVSATLTIF